MFTFWRTCPACCFYQYVFCDVPACLLVAPACLTFVRTRFLLFPTCLLLLATSDVPAYLMVAPACVYILAGMSGMLFLPICVLRCSSLFDGRSCMFNICTDTFSALSDLFATSHVPACLMVAPACLCICGQVLVLLVAATTGRAQLRLSNSVQRRHDRFC